MPEPWDRPPFPQIGDEDQNRVFEYIGRVSNAWEHLEGVFSLLYATLSGKHPFDRDARRTYGREPTFQGRLGGFRTVFSLWVRTNHDQDLEGGIYRALRAAEGFSQRRNDIIHGIVRPFHLMASAGTESDPIVWPDVWTYCVTPPYQDERRFGARERPEYLYSSYSMEQIEAGIYRLTEEAHDLVSRISGLDLGKYKRQD